MGSAQYERGNAAGGLAPRNCSGECPKTPWTLRPDGAEIAREEESSDGAFKTGPGGTPLTIWQTWHSHGFDWPGVDSESSPPQ